MVWPLKERGSKLGRTRSTLQSLSATPGHSWRASSCFCYLFHVFLLVLPLVVPFFGGTRVPTEAGSSAVGGLALGFGLLPLRFQVHVVTTHLETLLVATTIIYVSHHIHMIPSVRLIQITSFLGFGQFLCIPFHHNHTLLLLIYTLLLVGLSLIDYTPLKFFFFFFNSS